MFSRFNIGKKNLLCGLYLFAGRHAHHDAVEEDGDDDDEGEQRVHHDMNCHPKHKQYYLVYQNKSVNQNNLVKYVKLFCQSK